MGMAGSWMLAWRNRPVARYAAGLVLVGFATATLWHGFKPGASHAVPIH